MLRSLKKRPVPPGRRTFRTECLSALVATRIAAGRAAAVGRNKAFCGSSNGLLANLRRKQLVAGLNDRAPSASAAQESEAAVFGALSAQSDGSALAVNGSRAMQPASPPTSGGSSRALEIRNDDPRSQPRACQSELPMSSHDSR